MVLRKGDEERRLHEVDAANLAEWRRLEATHKTRQIDYGPEWDEANLAKWRSLDATYKSQQPHTPDTLPVRIEIGRTWDDASRVAAAAAQQRWIRRSKLFAGDRMVLITVKRDVSLDLHSVVVMLAGGDPRWLPETIAKQVPGIVEAAYLD